MSAARQLGFLGKIVQGPHDSPARRMLMACCQHKRKHGRPFLHNEDVIVQNLCLLFARIPEVVINDYGSVKDWFKKALNESYWTALIKCLLDKKTPLPARPVEWPPPQRRSPCKHPSSPHTRAMILGVSASTPRRKREKRASMRTRARQLSGSLRAKTVVRLEIVTKSSRNIFT